MPALTRRRLLTITAGLAATAALPSRAAPLTEWRGTALGAQASILLRHPDADRLMQAARAEIDRLEDIFSLFRPNSALSRLNAEGRIDAPPFEMLELLAISSGIHHATAGRFDPTIQPLWALYARHFSRGEAPSVDDIEMARALTGWQHVQIDASRIALQGKGRALTLNGIAQGYIADRIAALLRREGLSDVLVNTGEFVALGGNPDGGDWPITLSDGLTLHPGPSLRDAALASSSPLGTVFDTEGKVGHILDPMTGGPAPARWRLVSVTAPSAALADGLSTAFCLMDRGEIGRTLATLPDARIAALI